MLKLKFKCNSVEHIKYHQKAKLTAVGLMDINSEEDKLTADAISSGQLKICINAKGVGNLFFKPGKYYYLNIEEGEEIPEREITFSINYKPLPFFNELVSADQQIISPDSENKEDK